MDIGFTIGPTAYAGTLRASIYEEDAPLAEVQFQEFAPPHNVPRAIVFLGADEKPHRVTLKKMPAGTMVHDWMYRPKRSILVSELPLVFVIGDGGTDTPVATTSEYRNNFLAGKEYWVERRGLGTMLPEDTGILSNKEIDKVPEGGFDLIVIDPEQDVFNNGETFIIHFLPTLETNFYSQSIAGKWFDGAVQLLVNTPYDVAHLRKLIKLRAPLTYTLPPGDTFPVGFPLAFQSYGAPGNYIIAAQAGEFIESDLAAVGSITLKESQFLILMWDGDFWQIIARSSITGALAKSDNPDLNDTGVLATTVATKTLADRIKFIATGIQAIGNIPAASAEYIINHNLNMVGAYHVFGSFKSNSVDQARDDTIGWCYYGEAANLFKIHVQELNNEVQNVEFHWMIVQ